MGISFAATLDVVLTFYRSTGFPRSGGAANARARRRGFFSLGLRT
jgi:hypothetical protein